MTTDKNTNGINYLKKTLYNVLFLECFHNASSTTVGEFLGRLVTRLPQKAFFGGLAICIISDTADHVISNLFTTPMTVHDSFNKTSNVIQEVSHPKIKLLTEVLVRVAIGAGALVAGTALTGSGALLPAAIAGAKLGVSLYLANKVSKMATEIFRSIAFVAIHFVAMVANCFCLPDYIINRIDSFGDSFLKGNQN